MTVFWEYLLYYIILVRIVNVSNLDLGNARPVGDKTVINASSMLTTFRFLEGDKK